MQVEHRDMIRDLAEKYKTLKHQIDELSKEAKIYRDDIEALMIENDCEELNLGIFKITNMLVPVVSIDRKILERDFPEVYKQVAFVKNATRLTIS